jgi:acyl transferase domain-containing protein
MVNGYFGMRINDILISSTIWVHKADIDGDGKVTQPDFILFKLQQMQQVDSQILDRLIDRYNELDTDGSGFLTLGNEIPSEFQVEAMRHIKEELKLKATLVEMWLRIVKDGAQSKSKDVWFQNFMSWPRIKLNPRDKLKFQIESKNNAKQSRKETQLENAEQKRIARENMQVLQAQKENERLQKAKDKKATKEQLALEKLKLRKEKERVAEEKKAQKLSNKSDAEKVSPPKKKAPIIPQIRRTKTSEPTPNALTAKVCTFL